jgi:murein DD-endopeptidase MepM/ murein hydrolase activator NlpD
LAFEPDSQDQTIINKQRDEIAVSIGQIVKQGDLIGRLVVSLSYSSQVFGPHVHWGVDQLDTQGKPTGSICPRTVATPDAQTQLDELYTRLWQEQGVPNNDPVCVVLP